MLCNFYHIVFRLDFLVCCKHHRIFCKPINKDEINIFPGSSDLYFYMGQISVMQFAFVEQGQFYLAFPAVTQLRSKYPFIVVQQFAFCSQTYYIILPHGIKLEEHFVIIIPPVHDKGCFFKQSGCTFHSRESYIVDGSKILLF